MKKLKQKIIKLKEKFTNNQVNNKLTHKDYKKQLLFLALLGAGIVFPQVLIASLTIGLGYLVFKNIYPILKNWKSKFSNFITKKINKVKTKKIQDKKSNNINAKKSIKSVIKNFKLISFDRFKEKLIVKRDVNGHRIVDGSYRIKGKKIIDNKTYIKFQSFENCETKEKIYIKTK